MSQGMEPGVSEPSENNNGETTALLLTSNENVTQENPDFDARSQRTYGGSGYDDDEDSNQEFYKKSPILSSFRFWGFFSLGLVAVLILHLSFLPRTSLSRDFRRWHGLRLTKTDVQRNFLVYSGIGNSHNSLTTEQYIDNWLTNFTKINANSPVNIISDDNKELLSFVKDNFKKFGFKTESFTYDYPQLQKPVFLSIQLIDTIRKHVFYTADLLESKFETPAYVGFGANGSYVGDFIYVNEGTLDDYQLLVANNIKIQDKIVIAKSHVGSNLGASEKVLIAESFGAKGFIYYYDLITEINKESEKYLDMAISRDSAAHGPLGNFKKPSIVAVPINIKSAKAILGTLDSKSSKKGAFKGWDYDPSIAPRDIKLNVTSLFKEEVSRKLTNVVGTIKGIMNDGDIVIGARRDSFTSTNPLSNHAVMFEIMRNFQRLVILGWKPLRGIKFISWDGSNNGLLGSQLLTNDTKSFDPKKSIISYINIDSDCVMGSKFHVDANPMFEDILRRTARFIPIPKTSASYKTLAGAGNDDDEDDDDDDDVNYTTLHRYWSKQDNLTMNGILGQQVANSDALIFQNHLSTPVVNIRFDNDLKRDSSIYVPNSNFYSYDWLMKRRIDQDLLFHGLLIRYVGLLAITLSEHEVVHYKSQNYSELIRIAFSDFTKLHKNTIEKWSSQKVSSYLLAKTSLSQDLGDVEEGEVKFSDLIHQLNILLVELVHQSKLFDSWNEHVQQNLIEDYPWYKYYKKLGHYAQFKLANFKLLHLERQFKLSTKDFQYMATNATYFNHAIYGLYKFSPLQNNSQIARRFQYSTLTGLHEAIEQNDYELTIKWIVIVYDKIRNLNWFL